MPEVELKERVKRLQELLLELTRLVTKMPRIYDSSEFDKLMDKIRLEIAGM